MKRTFCCSRRPVSSPDGRLFPAERTSQQPLVEPDRSGAVGGSRLDEGTSEDQRPGGSQPVARKREAVLDRQRPSLHPPQPPVRLRLWLRDVDVEAWEPGLSSLLVCSPRMTSNISSPRHAPRPRPFFISQGKKD